MPEPAVLVCEFVNSYDVESDTDALSSPAALVAWLARRGLAGTDDPAGDEELAAAVDLRETLRAALRANHAPGPGLAPGRAPDPGGEPDGGEPDGGGGHGGRHGEGRAPGGGSPLPRSFDRLPVAVVLTPGGPVLEPAGTGVLAGLARIAAAVVEVRAEGLWPRLKVCTESTCQWAFVDSSKNRSRSWCSMKVCGNRTKTRAYRARRQTGTGSRHL
jgi:predicted RNA-binding Zn ribbon-like protein